MNNFNFSIVEGVLSEDPYWIAKDAKLAFIVNVKQETIKDKHSIPVRVVVKDNLSLICNKYLKEGSKVMVSGNISFEANNMVIEGKEVKFLKGD